MPKHDVCHDAVADALRREGWKVMDDLARSHGARVIHIDLRASRAPETMLIEVKCFPAQTTPDEQYTAIGQYLVYQTLLRLERVSTPLYLAVPVIMYENEFDPVFLETLQTYHINLLVFDALGKRNLQWIVW